jgi:hypothetical protein
VLSGYDIDGNSRIFNDTIDIGAYEVPSGRHYQPSDILLSNTAIDEDYVLNTAIGNFSTKDPDSDQFLYTFSKNEDAWHWDSLYFKLGGDSLYSEYEFDFNDQHMYYLTIKVEDEAGCELEKVFTITTGKVTVIDITPPDNEIKVYPNPTNGFLNFTATGSTQYQLRVRIYDTNGRLCMEQNLKADDIPLNLSQLSRGNYILKIDYGTKSFTKSIILE